MDLISGILAVPPIYLALLVVILLLLITEGIYIVRKRKPPQPTVALPTMPTPSTPIAAAGGPTIPQATTPLQPQVVQTKKHGIFQLKVLLPVFGIIIVGIGIAVGAMYLRNPKPQQEGRGRAATKCYSGYESDCYKTSVSNTCASYTQNDPIDMKLISHKYGGLDECLTSDPRSYVGDVGLPGKIVNQCTASDKHGDTYYCSQFAIAVDDCTAVQLDCMKGVNGAQGSVAVNCNNCNPPPTSPPKPTNTPTPVVSNLTCKNIGIVGDVTFDTIRNPGEVRTLHGHSEGGIAPITWTFTLSTNKGDKGVLTSKKDQDNEVIFTAPAQLLPGQTWTVTGTVHDSTGKSDSGTDCAKVITYVANPTPTPTLTITPTPTVTPTGNPSATPTIPVIPVCENIKIYSVDMTTTPPNLFVKQLTADDLKSLKAADKINVTVTGSSNSVAGQYRVNGSSTWQALTLKRAGTNEFYADTPYTLPAAVITYTFEGQIKDAAGNWH